MEESLFNPAHNKKILAYDLFDQKHLRNLKDFKFRIGVYGILLHQDQILVQRHPKLKTYGLPGGGVDLGESLETALIREFKEETGLKIKKDKLITVTEDFFTYKTENAQSVLISYTVQKIAGKLLSNGNHSDTAEVKFVPLKSLNQTTTQRVFWPIVKLVKDSFFSQKPS
jgi:8-oxo-dGTP diphosphatase